jgi:hypothetical protein
LSYADITSKKTIDVLCTKQQPTALHHSSEDTKNHEKSARIKHNSSDIYPETIPSVKALQAPKIPRSQSFKNDTKLMSNASYSSIKHKPFNICQQAGRIGSRAWMQNIERLMFYTRI